jgi:pentatricopeptide repeat protein
MNRTKIYSAIIFLLFLFNNIWGQDDCLLKYKADSLFQKQEYSEAINTYKQRQSRLCINYYMIAACFCKLEMTDSAEYYLQKAMENKFYYDARSRYWNITNLNSDTSLPCLNNNSRLDSLIENNYLKMFANINEELKNKFLWRMDIDQKVRRHEATDSLCKVYGVSKERIWSFVDSINMVFLDSVMQAIGRWPGMDFIGYGGDHAAWLIAQHADNFVEFQEKCYSLLLEAYENNNTDHTNIPYLYDRIMINKGLKQRYGTQQGLVDGKYKFINLENEDEEYINKLRRCYRLGTLQEYRKQLDEKFSPNKK